MRAARVSVVVLVFAGCVAAATPSPASASVCGAVGWINGAASKVCGVVTHGDQLISAGKKLATGHIGGAAKAILGSGGGGGGSPVSTAIGLAAIGTWVLGGAKAALTDTAKVLGETTSPRLSTTWFSSTYWRIAGIAAVLTLPFLFAAAVQALMRSDLALLARAALGYLPLSLLAVSIAAPLTMLLLAACDEMSAIVSSAAGHSGGHFLTKLELLTGGLVALSHSPFLAFLVGLLTAAGAIILWIEMLMREAAVYIVVLMLPLAFAALAWPARRVWAIRAVEMLVALILSKFAIVAVLSLGGAALDQAGGAGGMLSGLVLVLLATFAPWALVRLLPLAELASGAAGQLRGELAKVTRTVGVAEEADGRVADWAGSITAGMRRQADMTPPAGSGGEPSSEAAAGLESLPGAGAGAGEGAGAGAGDRDVAVADATPAGDRVLVAVGADREREADADGTPPAVAHGAAADSGDRGPGMSPRLQADGGAGAADDSGDRRPGMPPMFQAADREWRPFVFGPDHVGQQIWPADGDGAQAGADAAGAGDDAARAAEDHDPRPPEQASEDGLL